MTPGCQQFVSYRARVAPEKPERLTACALSLRRINERQLMNTETEEWRPVVGFEGIYEVSKLGMVRRVAPTRGSRAGFIRKTVIDGKGYPAMLLRKPRHKSKWMRVHRMLALAFIPNPDNKPQVNHKDGNRRNNALSNLEWVTNRENCIHAATVTLSHCGSRNTSSKINEASVLEIFRLRSIGLTQESIGTKVGLHRRTVSGILQRRWWRHAVPDISIYGI